MFDPKEGVIGGPTWSLMLLTQARELVKVEKAALDLAGRRVTAARAAETAALVALITSIPAGAGIEGVRYVPWEALREENDGWSCTPGGLVRVAAAEAIEVARILGAGVVVRGVNGADIVVRPGDTFEVVARRHHDAGGVGVFNAGRG